MTGRRTVLAPLAALALAAAAAGCGSSGGGSSSTGSSSGASSGGGYGSGSSAKAATTTRAAPASSSSGALKISAEESNGLSFDKKTLSAKAGRVTITMANPSGDNQPHGVAITGAGGVAKSGQVVQPGGTSTVSLDLRPGRYTFYCPVPGHRQAGMEGTLTVQ
ncbi:plastocyanin/azurin family copper-binding protein [Conexibacter woesei]|uniref:plastocyanin/azurin family copper-binding protein n=1 Tax=Conexibacter woesei TaxID=191495 RepID=UPI000415FA3B|nr:plastocyanin/azurin family copper-binding protein [Conexibacter woesei]